MKIKIFKKINRKIKSRIYYQKDSRYLRFKHFSLLIGIFVFCILSNSFVANAATIGKTLTSKPTGSSLTNGLVGHWTFDGSNLKNNVTDSSGQGHHGFFVNFPATSTAVVSGALGQALNFDAVDDYIDVGANDWLGTGPLTISAWVYPRGYGENANGSIIDNRKVIFGMYVTAGANTFTFSSDGAVTNAKSAAVVTFNKWYHVVATRDSAGIANIYINGVLSGTANQNSGTPAAGGFGVQIGNTVFASRTWDGYIDDLRVYNRILSSSEIKQLYNQSYSKIASTVSKPADAGLKSGLVGHWTFDGSNLKNNVTDSSGQGNNGILQSFPATSTAVVPGYLGQALNFDGVDDYVKLPDSASLQPSSFTIVTWINRNGPLATNQRPIISLHFNDVYLYIANSVSGLLYCGLNGLSTLTGSSVTPNVWHQVAVTYNGSLATLYLDGVSVDTKSGTLVWEGGTHYPRIGSEDSGTYFFDGKIDDVRTYNRALSINEIKQLYNQSYSKIASTVSKPADAGLKSGLVGHWTFDGKNLINNVTDSSGNGNTGILQNFPATSSVVVQGKVGQALTFNNDYVSINESTSLRTTNMTISFWMKSLGQNLEYLLFKDKASNVSYYIQNNNSANIKFCTTGGTCLSASNSGYLNNWVHVAITFDGSTGKFYKNGTFDTQQTSMNAIDYTSPNKLYIGYSSNAPQAVMDDVRIYNRVLSANEIAQIYNQNSSKLASTITKPDELATGLGQGLVGHWTMHKLVYISYYR